MGRGNIPNRDAVSGILREMRPRQWYKQGVMLIGILFSGNLFQADAWASLLLGITAFTATASALYIFNDILDRERDRAHPEKRHRPIANNEISVRTGLLISGGLLLLGGLLGSPLGPLFLLVLGGYVVQNILYSTFLKHVPFVEAALVGTGFVLRAIAGVAAIDAAISPWLITSTFLLALILVLGKRRHELETLPDPATSRPVLTTYGRDGIADLQLVTVAALLITYTAYTLHSGVFPTTLTLPFAYLGIFRYLHLGRHTPVGGCPERLFKDRSFIIILALWGSAVVVVRYGPALTTLP